MPDPAAPQLDELRRRARRRLVGAVVLALAAAVLVPMLLESDPKPLGEDVSVKIPPVDDGKFVTKLGEHAKPADASKPGPAKSENAAASSTGGATAPSEPTKDAAASSSSSPAPAKSLSQAEQRVLAPNRTGSKETAAAGAKSGDVAGAPSRAAESTSSAPASAPKTPATTPASPGALTKPSDAATSKTTATEASKPAASSASPAKAPGESFSVQLAAFADDKGANALAGKLKKAGHPAYTEPYASSRGTLWRVRVGPYSTRDAAEAARAKLKSEGQNGIIAAGR